MINKELMEKAVKVHFAIVNGFNCSLELEEYTTVAFDFYTYLIGGGLSYEMEEVLKRKRYRNKMILIQRYYENNR